MIPNVSMLVPPPLGTNRRDAGTHAGALSIPCAPVAYELTLLLLAVVGGPVCSDGPPSEQCSDSPHHMTIPTPDRVSYWDVSKGCAVALPLSPDKATDEDIQIDMSVHQAHDLVFSSGSRRRRRREWARHSCIGRELGDGFVHYGLSGSSDQ